MKTPQRFVFRRRIVPLAAALFFAACGIASAQVFDRPDPDFKGSVRANAPLILPGSEVQLEGSGFKPGQRVTLQRGATVLNAQPYVADAEGKFSARLAVPGDAEAGVHPVVVLADAPDAATVFELKVSKEVPLSGAERFDTTTRKLVQGLYQSAYSARNDALFVTSAVGRPPVTQSELLKLDPGTLEITARVTPTKVPGHDDDRVHAVYGLGVDDANGHVWVTNTREDTVAVYRQSDLSLVRQYPVGTVPHARDVIVDGGRGKVFVSATGEDFLSVFDAKTLEELPRITIASGVRGGKFTPMSLELDEAGGKLYTVGMGTGEVAVVDTATGAVDKVFALPNARAASGVAYDPHTGRVLVASQGSDNVLIADPRTGQVVHDVYVGAGALNVAYDPVSRLAYASNRAAGTVTVVDAEGRIVANLEGGTFPNHVHEDGKGHVFAVNKSRGADDPQGDRILRITPKAD